MTTTPERTCLNPACGTTLPPPRERRGGAPPRYCSPACRTAAMRWRESLKPVLAETPGHDTAAWCRVCGAHTAADQLHSPTMCKRCARTCRTCGTTELTAEQLVAPRLCKPCRTTANRARYGGATRNKDTSYRDSLRKLGWTPEEKAAAEAAQNNRCAVCHEEPPPGKSLHMDRHRAVRKRRDLLCPGCFAAVQGVRDNPETLEALAAYLRRHTPDA